MNKQDELFGNSLSSRKQPDKPVSRQAIQPKTMGASLSSRGHQLTHAPSRPRTIAKVVQAKMPGAPSAMASRSQGWSAFGVVQANVVGGNHALQARLNL